MSTLPVSAPAQIYAQRGLSLVELLVSMAIGIFLIGGAFTVYIQGRATYELNESIARMQENASFALKYLEEDIQLAGYWGTHRETGAIDGRASSNPPLGVVINGDCAANWSLQLNNYLEGSNDVRPNWACIDAADYVNLTDVLAVRRAAQAPVATAALETGRLYIRSSLTPQGQLFVGPAQPAGFSPDARNYPLVARAYYVSPNSVGSDAGATADAGNRVPSLRRANLTVVGNAPAVVDAEIVAGVEDLQVQFGIEPAGAATPGAVAYVDADNPLLATARIVAVRVWLLIRAEQPETGYVDDISYQLGNVTRDPTNDGFRRLLVSRTIRIRNR